MPAQKIVYRASNTGQKLHRSNKLIRALRGAVGTGKTVVCLQELWRLSVDQWPNSRNERLSRWVIIRNTSIELQTTTLNTFKQWFPPPFSRVTLNPYIKAEIERPLADGTIVKSQFLFLALDRDDDVRKLLSLEVSGGFINEAREISYSVLKALRERTGRYPARIDGYEDTPDFTAPRNAQGKIQPCKRRAIILDTNPCDEDHWWYQLAEEGCLRSEENRDAAAAEVSRLFDFFACPPPLFKLGEGQYEPNPDAENIEYLPSGYDYYLDMIGGNTPDHIKVMVLGQYGTIVDGRPVYPEYNDDLHSKSKVLGRKGFPICLGWDFGLTPAVVIGQMDDRGAVRILAELVSENMGARQFARDVVKPFIERYFAGVPIGFSYGDPAGNAGGEGEGKTAIGILNDDYTNDGEFNDTPLALGFTTEPAPTNDPTKRLDAVKQYLIRLIDGKPAIIVNRDMCQTLRKGLQGQYRFKKVQQGGKTEIYHDKPVKIGLVTPKTPYNI
jgi:hypothetical protein